MRGTPVLVVLLLCLLPRICVAHSFDGQEVYSLHRRLTGCFLTCIRLKAVIPCRDMLLAYTDSHLAGDPVVVVPRA